MKSPGYKQLRNRLISKAKENKVPILGHFELTSRCNLDCKMCYVHNMDNASAKTKELSTEQWIRIFDEAYDCGLLYASLSGGECLVRKDFKELYLHLWNKKVYITVMSNGTLLNHDYIEFFKQYQPDMIQISLYGSDEDGYLRVTGHKGYSKALHAISSLQDAGIHVRVSLVANKYMTDDFIKTHKMCIDNGIEVANNDILLLPNRDDTKKNDYNLTEEETVYLSIKRAEINRTLIPLQNTPDVCGPMTDAPNIGLKCNAGNCLATVTWDGVMYPCLNAMIGGISLLKNSYSDAWNEIVAAASMVPMGAECVGCAYNTVCSKCPSFRLTDLKSGHCNPQMCSLTRKLVAAGVKKLKT